MNPYRGGPRRGDDGPTFNRYATEARRRARHQLIGAVVLLVLYGLVTVSIPLWKGEGFVAYWYPRLLGMAALASVAVMTHLIMRWRNRRPDAFLMKLERETDAFLGVEGAPRGVEEPRVHVSDAAASSRVIEAENASDDLADSSSPAEAEARRARG